MPPHLVDINGAAVDARKISKLQQSITGRLLTPANADYDSARRIWNASIDKHPGLIVQCANAEDVVRSLDFARANAVLTAVRGGGHNVAGRALCDDGLVIDLSSMRAVQVMPETSSVQAEAGCRLGDVDRASHAHGLTVPLGIVSRTGIAGLTLGGGVGWLARKYGLTCDNLLACEVVTVDGRMVKASENENEDLFWGLRGGGGNFGVVTRFSYRARPVANVLGGVIVHGRARAVEVLRFYREFILSAPHDLTAYAGLLTGPDGTPVTAILLCWSGDLAEGERVLKPLREFGPPLVDGVRAMPFPEMQALLDDAFPDGNRNYWKSTLATDLADGAIDAIFAHAERAPSPLSAVVVECYGGAVKRVAPAATAFGQRHAMWDISILAQWTDPADTPLNVAWARALFDALKPYAMGASILNFLDQEEDAVIRASFGRNYDRLAKLKQKYDPDNFLRQNHNIRPSKKMAHA